MGSGEPGKIVRFMSEIVAFCKWIILGLI